MSRSAGLFPFWGFAIQTLGDTVPNFRALGDALPNFGALWGWEPQNTKACCSPDYPCHPVQPGPHTRMSRPHLLNATRKPPTAETLIPWLPLPLVRHTSHEVGTFICTSRGVSTD